MNHSLIDAKKAMQLTRRASPTAGFHHKIGGTNTVLLILGKLAKHRRIPAKSRITDKKFNKKGTGFSCALIDSRKGVPPPVVSPVPEGAGQHPFVSGKVVLIKHLPIPLFCNCLISLFATYIFHSSLRCCKGSRISWWLRPQAPIGISLSANSDLGGLLRKSPPKNPENAFCEASFRAGGERRGRHIFSVGHL